MFICQLTAAVGSSMFCREFDTRSSSSLYLIPCVVGPHECTCQTASKSVEWFKLEAKVLTARQTVLQKSAQLRVESASNRDTVTGDHKSKIHTAA